MAGQGAKAKGIGWQEETTPTLKSTSGGNTVPSIVILNDQERAGKPGGGKGILCGDKPFTLGTSQDQAVCYSVDVRNIAITEKRGTLQAKENGGQSLNYSGAVLIPIDHHQQDSRFKMCEDGVVPTLRATMGTGGNNGPMVLEKTFTMQGFGDYKESDTASPVKARDFKSATDIIASVIGQIRKYILRRLMPVECERLQGFPDGWTDIPFKNKPMSDSARYRMLGNSVAVPCVDFVFSQIRTSSVLDKEVTI